MKNVVFLATAWGTRHGGINSFNMDLAAAVSRLQGVRVFCAVFRPTEHEIRLAANVDVTLLGIDRPTDTAQFDTFRP